MQCIHGNIPHMFDSWADSVVHILLLNSSMAQQSKADRFKGKFHQDLHGFDAQSWEMFLVNKIIEMYGQ